MPVTIVNGPTIQAGQSLSDAADCSAGAIVRITTAADWTPANLSFQISTDGLGFNDLWLEGHEVVIPTGRNRAILLARAWPAAVHVKIRSGTSKYPVPQAATREFAIAILTP